METRALLKSMVMTIAKILLPNFWQHAPEKIRALNNWLQLYCNQQQHIYLNYHSHMVDSIGMIRTELSDDGVHPNEKGYQVMASLAEAVIHRALEQLEIVIRKC
jgi:acyl-CoA thioesterase I